VPMRLIGLAVVLAFGLTLAPIAPEAQQPGKVPRVGYLSMLSQSDSTFRPLRTAFREGLREHGYIEDQTITIEWRFAEGTRERLPDLAAELVRLKVDLIFAETTPAVRAAKQATTTIPIVFNPLADPVGEGFVANLARPGGNVTGLTQVARELSGKRAELLTEAVPRVTRVGVLSHSGVPSERLVKIMLEETEAAARALGVQLRRLEVQGPRDLDRPFAAITREKIGALIVLPSPMFLSERRLLVDLAAKNRLPAMFFLTEFVEAGGLMSYGPNFPELWRRTAFYVDKTLKGAKPGDLPVEQPTKFELVINLKTAKALGLTIPQSVLLQATQIIE
jgi:putative tryptophan/tyrosine transport system substrate-binding protein